jgi:putative transposase
MSRNYYAEINLHIVWHTKGSLPLLTPDVERFTHHYIRGRLINTAGVFIHEIGGTENHVHVVISVAPTVLISELIGRVKGSSSHEANRQFPRGRRVLEWQDGYGVVSFGTKDMDWVRAYVRNQREHHARGSVHDRLERLKMPEPEGTAEAERREAP